VLQIGFGLVEGADGELLRHASLTKTGELRKDKPDPVPRLSPGSQLSKDCVIDALLRVEKAVEIILISHVGCAREDTDLTGQASEVYCKLVGVSITREAIGEGSKN